MEIKVGEFAIKEIESSGVLDKPVPLVEKDSDCVDVNVIKMLERCLGKDWDIVYEKPERNF